jgi:hypothetical protein
MGLLSAGDVGEEQCHRAEARYERQAFTGEALLGVEIFIARGLLAREFALVTVVGWRLPDRLIGGGGA